jgi:hypothetical protein
MVSLARGRSKKIECGSDILQLFFGRIFQLLVVLKILRAPGLGEQAMGASDLTLRRVRLNPKNLNSLTPWTLLVPGINQTSTRTGIHGPINLALHSSLGFAQL